MTRWFDSVWCVTAMGLTNVTRVMLVASGVAMVNWLPNATDVGALEMAGLAPLNRYGGL